MQEETLKLLDEMIEGQKKALYDCAKAFIPNITPDDLLQPNDYPLLENNPHFRYEEGVLAGLQMVKVAMLAP